MKELLWWGYLHANNTIQVKRYFDDSYLQDCEESEFVQHWTRPFQAANREEAIKIASQELTGE